MQVKCPACNAGFSLEAALAVDAGRSALVAALRIPGLGGRLVPYLGLFRAKGRALAFTRVESLLADLYPMLDSQTITRNGLTRACPIALWQQGIERVLEARDAGKLQLPLKTHGYLLEIVAGLADHAGAQVERATEDARRRGDRGQQGAQNKERLQAISRARGDVELGLLTRDQAAAQLRAAGINPEVLNG